MKIDHIAYMLLLLMNNDVHHFSTFVHCEIIIFLHFLKRWQNTSDIMMMKMNLLIIDEMR